MNTINIAIYIDNDSDLNIIPAIKNFFSKKYPIVLPHIFHDHLISTYVDFAYLPTFYMSFYQQSLVFTNLENFLINQNNINSSDIYVITNKEELENNHMTKKELANIKLLSINNGEIYEL